MSIFEWLTQFKDEDSVLGDLVRDALPDPDFPRDGDFFNIFQYLEHRRVPHEAVEAFKKAYKSYGKTISVE